MDINNKKINQLLIEAIIKDDSESVNDLLEQGADPNGHIDHDQLILYFLRFKITLFAAPFFCWRQVQILINTIPMLG